MTTFTTIQLICPVCEKEFSSTVVCSYGHASKRSDFRPNYWGHNPVLLSYHLCPHCGFCWTNIKFETPFNNPAFKEEIMTLGPLKDASFERKIERALVCLEAMNDFGIKTCDEFYLANSWLELFWWGSSERLLKKSGTTALSYFEQALEKEIVPEDQIYAIRYLSAEINRRLGNIKKAAELFDTVISLTAGSEEFKWLYELATRQKTTPQENM